MTRELAKTASFSLTHLSVAVSVAYALTGNLRTAFAIGLIEPMVQTLAYFLHERAWKPRPAESSAQGLPPQRRQAEPRDDFAAA
ncbi:MAG: DUF2061 domain-containing protein [Alphaproteobacteria bacterium]|nr:DUF2061 domain-containing protein [Alphaproteobacteria bacterium]